MGEYQDVKKGGGRDVLVLPTPLSLLSKHNLLSSPLLSSLKLQIKLFCLSLHGWDWLNKGCEDEVVVLVLPDTIDGST